MEDKAKTQKEQPAPAPDMGSDSVSVGGSKDLIFFDQKSASFINLSTASKVVIAGDRMKVYDGGIIHEIKFQNVDAAKVTFGTLFNHHLAHNLVIGHPVPNQPVEGKNENADKPGSAVQKEKEVGSDQPASVSESQGSGDGSAGNESQPEGVSKSGETYHESSKELRVVK